MIGWWAKCPSFENFQCNKTFMLQIIKRVVHETFRSVEEHIGEGGKKKFTEGITCPSQAFMECDN